MKNIRYSFCILLFVIIGCASAQTNSFYEINTTYKDADVHIKIFNFLTTGSTTISNLGLLNGTDTTSYPQIISSNGGKFETDLKDVDDQGVSGFLVLVIQNTGNYTIFFDNLESYKQIRFDGNSIKNAGSIRVHIDHIIWDIRTTIVQNEYNFVILLSEETE